MLAILYTVLYDELKVSYVCVPSAEGAPGLRRPWSLMGNDTNRKTYKVRNRMGTKNEKAVCEEQRNKTLGRKLLKGVGEL